MGPVASGSKGHHRAGLDWASGDGTQETRENSLSLFWNRVPERAGLPGGLAIKGESSKVPLSIAFAWLHQNLHLLDIFLHWLPWSCTPANLVS